jgi:DNA-binding NarL/FixJ family response regulator
VKQPVALVLAPGSTAVVAGQTVDLATIDDEEFELTAVTVLATVTDDLSAAATLRAAQRGARLTVDVRLAEPHRSRFIEQLGRIATIRLEMATQLSTEHIALLDLLRSGSTLAEAAGRLFISRRTADRRLLEIREILGVATTTEALRAQST